MYVYLYHKRRWTGLNNSMKKSNIFFSIMAIFVLLLQSMPVTFAKGNEYANPYANTLNSAMLNCGVVSTADVDDYVDISNVCPTGVLYADMVNFRNNTEPCLVIVYSDGYNRCISTDIYRYSSESKSAELITTVRKPYSVTKGHIAELALADSGDYRYIVYTEYKGDEKAKEDCYTVIDNDAFMQITPPESKSIFGIASFTSEYLHCGVDISYYNNPLTKFFSSLKEDAAQDVTYTNILDNITEDEHARLSRVLARTSEFTNEFDIGDYSGMSQYSLAVNRHNGEGKFNAITHIYDLGDEIYYVRYSTDLCFYNGTILRRTDKVTDNYQILNVRNDFIPFSDAELNNLKAAYMKNRLVLEKSGSSAELINQPLIEVKKVDFPEMVDVPQVVSPELRIPAALIGGGIILALFIFLWVYFSSKK